MLNHDIWTCRWFHHPFFEVGDLSWGVGALVLAPLSVPFQVEITHLSCNSLEQKCSRSKSI